jgi:2,4-dienoyl-CoA reductase (NADPH2)
VALVEAGTVLGAAMAPPRRWRVLHELRARGVALHAGARAVAIDDAGVHLEDAAGGAGRLPADAVLLAEAGVANTALAESLAREGRDVHTLGDCRGVGYVEGALLDAIRIARAI